MMVVSAAAVEEGRPGVGPREGGQRGRHRRRVVERVRLILV